jgi:putative ABC transport system permease protein
MKLSKNIPLSIEILAAHKLRTLLSILGIVVGVTAVVVMVAVAEAAEERVLRPIRDMGTNLIVVNAGQTRIIAGRQRQVTMVTTLVPHDAEAIVQECPTVLRASPGLGKRVTARWEEVIVNTTAVGMAPEGFSIRNFEVASGRPFTEAEDRARVRLAVLGPTVAVNLFGDSDPVGRLIRIERVPFEVVGVTKPKGLDPNGVDQDDLILVPVGTAMRRLMNVGHVDTIFVQVRDGQSMDRAEEEIRQVLRRRHRLVDKPDDFTIQNQASLLAAEREVSASLKRLTGSVAAISLLVGGVGISAVMLISIRERRAEIGLRRALGARRRDIGIQFLVESVLLAGSGGVLGVTLGVAGAYLVGLLGWETAVSWPLTVAALASALFLGVFSGLHPANRASRLEPIEALAAK